MNIQVKRMNHIIHLKYVNCKVLVKQGSYSFYQTMTILSEQKFWIDFFRCNMHSGAVMQFATNLQLEGVFCHL